MIKRILLVVFAAMLLACDNDSKIESEIAEIPMEVKIMRFDREFAQASPENLAKLKAKYPLFFPKQFHDSIWLGRMTDSLQQELDGAVAAEFPSEEKLEAELLGLFQHIKYYFPEFKAPTVVTTTSDVDYQNKAIVADTLLVLSLDTYLGAEHPFYEGIQRYIAANLKASQLPQDVAQAYARQLITRPRARTLLAQMVYYGKELYLKDKWLPETTDAEKIGYSEAQMTWALENEEYMWRYFVERELLYSTDAKLSARFIVPAPFSKFYLEIDNESPGMVGQYLGWQIVRAYMEKNPVSVKQLMITDAETIFKGSNYKPKKK